MRAQPKDMSKIYRQEVRNLHYNKDGRVYA